MPADWSNRYLRDIVVKWFDRSQDMETWPSVFDRFIFLWIAYEAWGSSEARATGSKKVIAWLETSKMREAFDENSWRLEGDLRRLSEKGAIPSHVEKQEAIQLDDSRDFGKVMRVLYRIRNNLFHGHKSLNDKDDEEYVALAYHILSSLVKPCVEGLRGNGIG